MINLNEQYPNKTAGVTPNYPFGQARNVTLPGDRKGTPWDQALVNDLIGFQQAAMKAANMVPTGVPDNANNSQVLTAIMGVFKKYCFCVDQDWKDVKSARVLGATYQNPNPKPITLFIRMSGQDSGIKVTENNFVFQHLSDTYNSSVHGTFVVIGPFSSYKIEKSSFFANTLLDWFERS